jgi:Tol biopolymer transport system component
MPAWSPKGTHIVFARGKDVEAAPAHIWVIELRSGSERQVTFGNAKDYFPDWR